MGRKEKNGVGNFGEQKTSREIGGIEARIERVMGRKEGNGVGKPGEQKTSR
jgi:hypothetical protein